MANTAVYVTHEGLKKLEEELEFLHTVKRQEVAQRLHEAMEDGELIENAEYEAAKNEQAFVEGRILELEHMLAVAKVIEQGGPSDVVRIGSTVVVQEDGLKPEEYKIVGAAEANPKEGLISNESPLGKSLLDHRAGEEGEVKAPAGTLRFRGAPGGGRPPGPARKGGDTHWPCAGAQRQCKCAPNRTPAGGCGGRPPCPPFAQRPFGAPPCRRFLQVAPGRGWGIGILPLPRHGPDGLLIRAAAGGSLRSPALPGTARQGRCACRCKWRSGMHAKGSGGGAIVDAAAPDKGPRGPGGGW